MADQALVSVVVTCYNYAQYLAEALDSVLCQTYQNWECIIVDDGSTDDTERTALVYVAKDDRFRYQYQANQGVAVARNNGISQSRGEYILPLDADDRIEQTYVAKGVEILDNQPAVKVVYCRAEYFGEKSGEWHLTPYSLDKLLFENLIFCSGIFRKKEFNQTEGYDSGFKHGYEDWDFWLTFLSDGGQAYKLPEVLFYYRIKQLSRDTNLVNNKTRYLKTVQRIFKKHTDLYKKHPLTVSVIIPNYNHARYLPKRIESVLNQTFPFFEVILMDDCSTDNSREVIEHYAAQDDRIQVIYNEKNSGSTFKQWNRGVKEAKGAYIWIAESDDYADCDFLQELISHIIIHPTANIIYCQSWSIDGNNNILGTWIDHTKERSGNNVWKDNFILSGRLVIQKFFLKINVIPNASAVVFRRQAYQMVNGANEGMKLNGDWLLWINMLLDSDLVFLAKPMNYFRTHTHNVRKSTVHAGKDIEELSFVLQYVVKAVSFSKDEINRALHEFIRDWLFRNTVNSISIRTNINIFNNLKTIDSYIFKRLIKVFIKHKGEFRKTIVRLFKDAISTQTA